MSPAVLGSGDVTFVAGAPHGNGELALLARGENAELFIVTTLGDGATTVPFSPGLHDFGLAELPADFGGNPASLDVERWLTEVEVAAGQGTVVLLDEIGEDSRDDR